MPGNRKLLIQQLQENLVPALIARGFQQLPLSERDGKSRDMVSMLPLGYLKRQRDGNLDIVEIQIHPRRMAFVIGFGTAPPEGVILPWAKLAQTEVGVSSLAENCRLYANRRFMTWFGSAWTSFYKDQSRHAIESIQKAVSLLPELDEYFGRGAVGPHIKCVCQVIDPTSGQLKSSIRSS
jgi:hypothetical protein